MAEKHHAYTNGRPKVTSPNLLDEENKKKVSAKQLFFCRIASLGFGTETDTATRTRRIRTSTATVIVFCCANFNYKLCPRNCTRLPFAHTQQIMWIFRHILNGICLLRFYVNFRAWILVADLIFVSTWNTIHKRSNWFNITLKWICLCLCVQNNWINKQIKCRVCVRFIDTALSRHSHGSKFALMVDWRLTVRKGQLCHYAPKVYIRLPRCVRARARALHTHMREKNVIFWLS